MKSREKWCCLVLALVILLGAASCSGILQESQYDDGKVERLRIQGGEGWKSWDTNATKADEGAVILKKETTF